MFVTRLGRIAALIAAAAGLVLVLVLGSGNAARAEGLNFGCTVADPDAIEPPVLGDANVTDIDTGSLSGFQVGFTGKVNPGNYQVGPINYSYLDLQLWPDSQFTNNVFTVDFNQDGITDLTFWFGLRFVSDGTRMESLLAEQFNQPISAVPPNPLLPFLTVQSQSMVGIDLFAKRNTNPGALDFVSADLHFKIKLKFTKSDGTDYEKTVDIGTRTNTMAWDWSNDYPNEVQMGFGYRPSSATNSHGWWLMRFHSKYQAPYAGTTKRPGLVYSMAMYDADLAGNPIPNTELFRADAAFKMGPDEIAAGTNQQCAPTPQPNFRSRGHLAWNHANTATLGGNAIALKVLAGAGAGIDGADELNLDMSTSSMPAKLNMYMRPDAIQIDRSTPTATQMNVPLDIAINKLQSASLDENLPEEQQSPFVVSGALKNLPLVSVLRYSEDVVDGSEVGDVIDAEFCPPADPGIAVSQIGTYNPPYTPCPSTALTPDSARVRVQNFIDGDPEAASLPELPPTSSTSSAVYGANSYPVSGSSETRNVFRAGGDVLKPRRVTVKPSSSTVNDRSRVRLSTRVGQTQSTRVIMHFDGRTDRTNEELNKGSLIDVDATVVALPTEVDIDFWSEETKPLHLDWAANSTIFGIQGRADAQLSGPDATRLASEFLLAGVPMKLTLDFAQPTDDISRIVYDASAKITAKFGVFYNDRKDRKAGVANRAWADAVLERKGNVEWETDTDELKRLEANACTTLTCDNILKAVVIGGPIGRDRENNFVSPANLLDEPALPTTGNWLGTPISVAHKPFTNLAGEGVRYVGLDDRFGIKASVTKLRKAVYRAAPNRFCVNLDPNSARGPFVLNMFDNDLAEDDGIVDNAQLYLDGTVNPLPTTLGARIDPQAPATTDPSAKPFVYTTTVDCKNVDEVPTSVGSGQKQSKIPGLKAIVRYGDNKGLLGLGKKSGPTVSGEPSEVSDSDNSLDVAAGITVRAHTSAADITNLGLQARIVTDFPQHLKIWKPLTESCADFSGPWEALCRDSSLPTWEMNDWRKYGVRYASSFDLFGSLDMSMRQIDQAASPVSKTRYVAKVSMLPGSWRGEVRLDSNRRLPRTKIDGAFSSNKDIPQLTVEVWDLVDPGRFGVAGEAENNTAIPRYSVILKNVPKSFALDGEMHVGNERGAFEDVAPDIKPANFESCTDKASHPVDTDRSPNLGYFRTILDLKGAATVLDLTALAQGDEIGVDLRAIGDLGKFVNIDGSVSARVNDLLFSIAESEDDLGGAYVCLDFDLPLWTEWTNAATIAIGAQGPNVTYDAEDASGNAFVPPIHVGEKNFGALSAFAADQVFNQGTFARRHFLCLEFDPLDYDCDDMTLMNDTDIRRDIRIFDIGDCGVLSDPEEACYNFDDQANLPLNVYPQSSSDSKEMTVDAFLNEPLRDFLAQIDAMALPDLGGYLYSMIWEMFPPNWFSKWDLPVPLTMGTPIADTSSLTLSEKCGSALQTDVLWDAAEDAVAADGTLYEVEGICGEHLDSVTGHYDAYLDASWPTIDGGWRDRWRVKLRVDIVDGEEILDVPGAPSDFECDVTEDCIVTYTIDPNSVDGSVRVTTHFEDPDGVEAEVVEVFDASGLPGDKEWSLGTNLEPTFSLVSDGGTSLDATIDACPHVSWACSAPPPGFVRVWVLGDGTVVKDDGIGGSAITHRYPALGQYRAELIEYMPLVLGWNVPIHRASFKVLP